MTTLHNSTIYKVGALVAYLGASTTDSCILLDFKEYETNNDEEAPLFSVAVSSGTLL